MPFFFNFKSLLGLVFSLTILFVIIFFFAFFAIVALPLIVLIYLFRRKIFSYFFKKTFSHKFHNFKSEENFYNNSGNNKDFIEVDYEKDTDNKERN